MENQEVNIEYTKPTITKVATVAEYVNNSTNSFVNDGGEIEIPGVGKLLLTKDPS